MVPTKHTGCLLKNTPDSFLWHLYKLCNSPFSMAQKTGLQMAHILNYAEPNEMLMPKK